MINQVTLNGTTHEIKDYDATDINTKLRNSIQRVEGRATDSNPMRDPFVWLELPSYEFPTMLAALDNLVTSGAAFGNYFCWLGDQRVMIVHNALSTGGGYIQLVLGTCFSVSNGQLTHSVTNHTAGIFSRVYTGGSYKEWKVGNQDYITAQISALLNGTDPDKIDSLKELVSWVEEHGAEASEMASAIEKNATDIANEVTRAKTEEAELLKQIKGTKDIEPREYPFRSLGGFASLDSLVAKLDTLAIITTDSPNTKLVGSFRAIRDQKIYTIYNECASWNGVFIQTIMGCLTIGNDGKLASSDSSWGIYRRTSSNNNGNIKWGNWQPVADSLGADQYLGSFSSYTDLIKRLNSLWYNQKDVMSDNRGNCTGWFKAKVSGHPIDIRSQYTNINNGQWQQIISGFFALQSDNSITLTSDDYQTLFRKHIGDDETDVWSNWKKISAVQ